MTVRFTWESEADAGYIALTDIGVGEAVHQGAVADCAGRAGEVILDFDASGRLLGVELLGGGQLPADLGTS